MRNFLLGLAFVILLVVGCTYIQNHVTPAKVPKELAKYAGTDPNKIGYESIDKLENLMESAKIKNITTQANLLYLSKMDAEVYAEVAKAAQFRLEQAKIDADKIFGQNGLLIMGLGLMGGGVLASMYKNSTMYSTQEVEAEKVKATETAKQILYTPEEVQVLVAKAKSGSDVII